MAFLVGRWSGTGHGEYPTIVSFAYTEEIVFGHVGKPFLSYAQKTRRSGDHPEAGMPLHAETGYLRPGTGDEIELVIAQPSGIVEIDTGALRRVDGRHEIRLRSRTVATTPTAKNVATVERRIAVEGDLLTYELWMGAVDQPHQFHLAATLHRRS